MPETANEPEAQKPIVLFLDDNPDILEVYEAYFGHNGFTVLTTSRAANAIQLAETHPVKVAVVDYEMPEINGHQAAVALKGIRPTLPVILVSGSCDIPPEALQAVDFFVSKGDGPSRLNEVINTFVKS